MISDNQTTINMHITTKNRVLQFISHKGINKTIFLNDTNIKRGFLDKDKLGASVSDLLLEKIVTTYPEINLNWLITGKGDMLNMDYLNKYESKIFSEDKTTSIPVYTIDEIANANHTLFNSKNSEAILSIPHMPNCDGAIYIHTDSMYPILKTGDLVCYKKILDFSYIYWGEMYILDIFREDEENYLTFKYIYQSELGDDYVNLRSHNSIYPPQDILRKDIKRMGLVKVCIRYNRPT